MGRGTFGRWDAKGAHSGVRMGMMRWGESHSGGGIRLVYSGNQGGKFLTQVHLKNGCENVF